LYQLAMDDDIGMS